MDVLAKVDPDLALIKNYLLYSHINPKILPVVIDQLNLIAKGSGFGSVIIEVMNNKITYCRGIDDRKVELEIIEEISNLID